MDEVEELIMPIKSYLSTNWLEVGRIGFSTMVKVVLTDESEAYLISVTNVNGKPEAEFFEMKGKFAYDDEEEFLKAVIDDWSYADKLPVESAIAMCLVNTSEITDVVNKINDQ